MYLYTSHIYSYIPICNNYQRKRSYQLKSWMGHGMDWRESTWEAEVILFHFNKKTYFKKKFKNKIKIYLIIILKHTSFHIICDKAGNIHKVHLLNVEVKLLSPAKVLV